MNDNDQSDLFGNDAPDRVTKYQPHSITSRQAAKLIEADAKNLRGKVYEFIRLTGNHGATDEEIQIGLAMNPSTQRPRRVELFERGLIVSKEDKRRTRSKRFANIWVVRLL